MIRFLNSIKPFFELDSEICKKLEHLKVPEIFRILLAYTDALVDFTTHLIYQRRKSSTSFQQ